MVLLDCSQLISQANQIAIDGQVTYISVTETHSAGFAFAQKLEVAALIMVGGTHPFLIPAAHLTRVLCL